MRVTSGEESVRGASGAREAERTGHLPERLEQWRAELLDLSARNPLLRLRSKNALTLVADAAGVQDLVRLLTGEGRPAVRLVAADAADGLRLPRRLAVSGDDPHLAARMLIEDKAVVLRTRARTHPARLDSLRRANELAIEETGAATVFLAIGLVRWQDPAMPGAAPVAAPAYLLPVELRGSSVQPYTMAAAEPVALVPNHCLIEKLRRDLGVTIPALADPPRGDDLDLPRLAGQIGERLSGQGIVFGVETGARLALLDFARSQMWRDVTDNWPELMRSPVVAHLVRTPAEIFGQPGPEPALTASAEAGAYLPLPADSSQLRAVLAARAGRSFVLQGPPGTGKSATIANIIADSLAHGRTVLFVAGKQAALDVVRRRLEEAGLGALALDLHGRSMPVAAVRAQLDRAWNAAGHGDPAGYGSLRADFARLIAALDEYPHLVHAPGPAGYSAWQLTGQLIELTGRHDGPPGTPGPVWLPASVVDSDEAARAAERCVADLVRARDIVRRTPGADDWLLAGDTDPEAAGQVAEAAAALAGALAGLTPALRAVLSAAGDPQAWPRLLPWLADVDEGVSMRPECATALPAARLAGEVARLRDGIAAMRDRYAGILDVCGPAADTIDIAAVRRDMSAAGQAGVLARGARRRRVVDDVNARSARPHVTWETLPRFLDELGGLRAAQHQLARTAGSLLDLTGWRAGAPDAGEQIERAARRAAATRAAAGLAGDTALLDALVTESAGAGGLADATTALADAWDRMRAVLAVTGEGLREWLGGRPLLGRLEESVPAWQEASRGRLVELDRLRERARAAGALAELGLGELAAHVLGNQDDPATAVAALRYRITAARLEERLRATALDTADPAERAGMVQEYAQVAAQVRARLVHELPGLAGRGSGFDRAHPTPEQERLHSWITQRRGGSVRALMRESGQVVQQVTPCLMMSPASVARYLPAGPVRFDTVIFDEASQIRMSDALGALGRAQAAVVAGDSEQLPPGVRFEAQSPGPRAGCGAGSGPGGDGADEAGEGAACDAAREPGGEDGAGLPRSVLTEAIEANLPSLPLRWHYRSQCESLIAFSNREYYGGELATFPAPPGSEEGLGVSVRMVEGTFERENGRRVNVAEADAIVEEVTRRLLACPDASIGVITFNAQQRDLILDRLEASGEPAVRAGLYRRSEPVFVKNLENVQGDERDAVLFSLAFSPDPVTGRVPLTFGPLMHAGGQRRLNVAITRARREVVLFTSFRAADLDLDRTGALGLIHLRDYLAFAESGAVPSELEMAADVPHPDRYRERLAAVLRRAGLEVAQDVGAGRMRVDLAVRGGDGTWLAVLLDGPGWAGQALVADRDGIPAQVLAKMGWAQVVRVLLTEWARDEAALVRRITDLAGGSDRPVSEPAPRPGDGPAVPATGGDAGADALAAAVQAQAQAAAAVAGRVRRSRYVFASRRPVGVPDVVENRSQRRNWRRLQEEIGRVVAVEGPVSGPRLARIVAGRFGVTALDQAAEDGLLACAGPDVRAEESGGLGTWFWPVTLDPDAYRDFRDAGAGARPLTQVGPAEAANAMTWVLAEAEPLSRDELIGAAAGALGGGPLDEELRAHLGACLDWALERGRLAAAGDGICRAHPQDVPAPAASA